MARVGYNNLPRLTHQIARDAYVCTMVDQGSSACYADVSYDMSRSGNTMYYTVRVAVRMGDSTAWSAYKWKIKIKTNRSHDSGWLQVKWQNGSNNTVGTDWHYTDYSFSVNTNTEKTSILLDWASLNANDTIIGSYHISNYNIGSVSYITPSAPSAPKSASVPAEIAPDRTASLSWEASSGGTNGVSGYEWVFSKDGGASWQGYETYTSSTSVSLNLNDNKFVHNSKLRIAVRSYSTVNGSKYLSGWTYSNTTTTKFVAPSAPRNLSLVFNTEEPIPTARFTGSWAAPSSGGTNGISGYTFSWLKNGSVYTSDVDLGNTLSNAITLTGNYEVGSKISFRVRAYTIGQNNKYYSSFSTSGQITIVSDKYIFVSLNGGAFDKRKMYVSVNGASFKEVKKDKFSLR